MAWIYLILAGLLEIVFTTSMRHLGWPLQPLPLAVFLVSATLSFWLLIVAIKTIPLGTAYAVWTGIGAAGTVITGIVHYGEPLTTLRVAFLVTLIGSIAGLKMV